MSTIAKSRSGCNSTGARNEPFIDLAAAIKRTREPLREDETRRGTR